MTISRLGGGALMTLEESMAGEMESVCWQLEPVEEELVIFYNWRFLFRGRRRNYENTKGMNIKGRSLPI